MEYVKLGETGLEVSKLCLGTWMFGTESEDDTVVTDCEQAHDLLDAAWEHGINFFDTANNYGGGDSERYIGGERLQQDELLDELLRLTDELERPPTTVDMRKHGEYAVKPYYRQFGSWETALEAAEIADIV